MELAKVIGQVVSTVRVPSLPPNSLLLVALLDDHGKSTETCVVALDPIGAGDGEWVIVTRGSSSRCAVNNDAPVDAVIVGIVDHVTVDKKAVYKKNV